jgi:general secretion pathway protein L
MTAARAAPGKMPTSSADPGAGAQTLLLFVGEGAPAPSAAGRWLLVEGGVVVARGEGGAAPPRAARTVLAVPGEEVSLHWLDLDEGLTVAQASAAARLMLADASAEALSAMHVAVGRGEQGRTVAAIVPTARMSEWLAAAAAAGVDPDTIVPAPLLLPAPETGFLRRDRGERADYRGSAAAFTLEPELAEAIVGDSPVELLDEGRSDEAVAAQAAAPPLNLRQGAFARRRQWRLDRPRLRRIAFFAIALAFLTLAVQIATILAYTFSADRLQDRADALAAQAGPAGADRGPGFGAAAAMLFAAVEATPNAELAGVDYRSDGTLTVTVTADSPATLSALQGRLEAGGFTVAPGESRTNGGRLSGQLTLRPA